MYRYICPEGVKVWWFVLARMWSSRREPDIAQYGSIWMNEFDDCLKQNKGNYRCYEKRVSKDMRVLQGDKQESEKSSTTIWGKWQDRYSAILVWYILSEVVLMHWEKKGNDCDDSVWLE